MSLIYEVRPHEPKISVTTMDQFGLNELDVQSSKWLAVPVQMVRPASQATN